VVAGTGRVLIAMGTLILLFVAYQLWGTGLAEARSQDRLRGQFEEVLGAAVATTPPRPAAPPTAAPPPTAPPPAPVGDAVAILRIPSIGVDKTVVEGVALDDLKKGPGHYPDTPLPGQPGNASIAGHRTTYGAPFYNLDELDNGDEILVTTRQGEFRYEVVESKVVRPSETSVLDPTSDNRLTLTTCEPRFSAAKRLVVVAVLAPETTAAPAPVPAPLPLAPPDRPAPRPSIDPAGLSGEGASDRPALLWGLAAALVAAAIWAGARFWRRWPAYLLGVPVFLVVLFIFFENFSRLLPANF
ncbi:MAG: class E sortase, partial [Acidimicrobiales bacterium]